MLKRLLHQAAQVGIRCRLLLLDRGFYSVGVIRYLQAARQPFLMPVICRGRKLDDPRGPSGTNVFLTWQSSGFGTYTLHDAQKRPARVGICVKCRYYRGQWQRHGKQHLIYAFWEFQPPSFDWVRQMYRRRFAIETTYRQLHQARIRTSTRDPALRLLFVGIALILRNVWVRVVPDGAGPAPARQSRDPLGFAAVPEDVAVVEACGGSDPGGPQLGSFSKFGFDQEL